MSEKMPEQTKFWLVNAGIIAGLIWCCLRGNPLYIVLVVGTILLISANVVMYVRRKKTRDKPSA